MCGHIACIAAVLLGVDAGWQPLPEGGIEYIIQIEPQLLETLKSGEPIQSDVPSYVKDVRAYRIVVGTAKLPRELPPQVEGLGARGEGLGARGEGRGARGEGPAEQSSIINRQSPIGPGTAPPITPNPFEPTPGSKRIDARQADYLEPSAGDAPGESKSPSESQSPSEQEPAREASPPAAAEKPWTPLIVALFTLFGSLGANVYLGWITWYTRSRYRSLVGGMSQAELQ
jgi:hypothetical protein